MPRPLAVLLLLAGTVATIAGCGSSSSGPVGGSSRTSALAYVHCLRTHGVPNIPDPGAEGGIRLPSGVNLSSPAFEAAQASCANLVPSGGAGGRRAASRQDIEQMLALSTCMRAHGVSGFPDPTLYPPSNPQQYSIAFARGGVSLLIPKSVDVASPAFKQAAGACRFGALLPKGHRTAVP